ncbi:restriction endonuclease subunit S [Aliarcobacter butzleri]|uniref:restriction endonuclease subunit S n=1 Tax=Aliarcobacter butzleri TaxID=28197 RepID=UPI001260EAA7|nr:restriction endonuclease subunit S [Aliarcobacter butzleri]
MNSWKECKLGDIAEILNHVRVPLSAMERAKKQGKFPYYGASGIIDYVDDYLFDGEYVLISEDGENLKSRKTPIAFKASGKFWVNNHAHIVQGKKPFLNDLIIYYFKNLDLNEYITGAVQPKLNKANLLEIPFYLPESEEEQKAIVEVLSSLDDKIDLLHRQNQTLESLAQTLFRQWFIEEAKEEWEIKFSDAPIQIIDGDRGNNYPKNSDFFTNEYCLFLSARNVTKNGFDFSDCQFITKERDELLRKGKLSRNDVVLTTRGTVGNIAYYHELIPFENIRINSGMVILRADETKISPLYLYILMKSPLFCESVIEHTSGSAQPQLPIRDLNNVSFILPPKNIYYKFMEQVKPIYSKVFNNQKQIQTLEKLRDTLLPKLLSGEVRVKI